MLVHNTRYLKLEALVVWWPETTQEVIGFLDRAPVVILWQCPESLAAECRRWVFRRRPFFSPLIDLGRTEEELWHRLEPKSCRYEIRKAQKMECVILRNEETESARALLNDSIRRQSYRPELGQSEWDGLLPTHDVFLCKWEGMPLVVHLLMRDFPGRARLVLSGSVDRNDPRFHKVVGPLNRLLHWHELLRYKAEGFGQYDFGGSPIDKNSPQYSITQFKLSFGAEIATQPHLYLAKKPALRGFLRGIGWLQGGLRIIPWPKTWLAFARANLKSAFLRG
jgi:hypothetical protein